MGRAHRREDRARHGARAAARDAGRVPRRLGGGAYHRPGRAVPRPAGRGAHLRQRSAVVGQGAAGVLPVRAVGRGRGVHPRLLRRGVHGRGQRVDVPRLAPDGRGGDRREGVARRDGRRAHARNRERLRRQPVRVRRRGDRLRAPVPLVPADELAAARAGRRARARRSRRPGRSATSFRSRSGGRTTCTGWSTRSSTRARSSS